MIDLEIETIGAEIESGTKVLDVGCANGYAALRQYEARRPSSIVGVDFAGRMIEAAQSALSRSPIRGDISFKVGDVRNLEFADDSFDVVYTTRVLINLKTWEEQCLGIDECIRVTKAGGKIIFSEAFWEPLMLLNAMRQLVNLPPLVEHDFNRYLKIDRLQAYLTQKGLAHKTNAFSSVYYLGSRFLRELVTNPPDYPGYENPVNKIFFDLERQFSCGGFGVQQAVIVSKPGR
jgi:ubiquinone/menaquinone biosynthesis C-methylase UbiE